MKAPSRPALRWLGGKFRLAPWIVSHFPPHRIYLEPFGGAASVLLHKPPSYNEVYNDLDGDLVNLFTVLRGDRADELVRSVFLTPYAKEEYWTAFEPTDDPVERARRLLVRSHMGHGTGGTRIDRPTGFRTNGMTATTNVGGEWAEYPVALREIIERVKPVVVHQKPALDLIREYDDPKVLIYLDPPYMPATRSEKSNKGGGERYHTYNFELGEADHVALLEALAESKAMIVLSGYPDPLYDEMLAGWDRRQVAARAHRNSPRTEVLWINPAATKARSTGPLFDVAC